MLHRLYVCVTCVRDLPVQPGEEGRGRTLAQGVEAALATAELPGELSFIRVPCLSGCLNPCNIALRASRKYNIRFSRVQPEDANDVVTLTRAYMMSESGDIPDAEQPASLRAKLSARLPPPHLMLAQAGLTE